MTAESWILLTIFVLAVLFGCVIWVALIERARAREEYLTYCEEGRFWRGALYVLNDFDPFSHCSFTVVDVKWGFLQIKSVEGYTSSLPIEKFHKKYKLHPSYEYLESERKSLASSNNFDS